MSSGNSCQHSVVRYGSYLTLNCLFQIPGRDGFECFQHKKKKTVFESRDIPVTLL